MALDFQMIVTFMRILLPATSQMLQRRAIEVKNYYIMGIVAARRRDSLFIYLSIEQGGNLEHPLNLNQQCLQDSINWTGTPSSDLCCWHLISSVMSF